VTPSPASLAVGLSYVVLGPAGSDIGFGDKVDIRDPSNPRAGSTYYEVANIGEEVTLNTNIIMSPNYWEDPGPPVPETRLFFSEAQVEFFTEYLEIEAPPGSTFSIPTTATSTAIGLDPGGLLNPITTGKSSSVRIPVNLSSVGAAAGDIIEVNGAKYTVQGVTFTDSGTIVQLPTTFDYVTSAMSYRYLSGQYDSLQSMLNSLRVYPNDFVSELDILVVQVLQGKSATRIYNELTPVSVSLASIKTALTAYTSPGRSVGLDAAVAMMREQGMDRAVDMLLSLRLIELFTMNKDGVSYNTNLARTAATATRVVSPMSKSQIRDEEILGTFRSDNGISR
jgi:hypothetical protein